jgi:N,N'-diacetyllegionaminate synthase
MIGKNFSKESKINLIAEIANTHQGDLSYLFKLLKLLKKNKIEYVKFQIYNADELLTRNHKRYKHFLNQSFDYQEWDKVIDFSKKHFNVCADVFGEQSLNYVLKKKLYGIKIHSSDLINKKLILKLTNYTNKVFISTGGSNFREINYVLRQLKKCKLVLMHGYQNYPTLISDTSLNRINSFKKIYKNKVLYGIQDHLSGYSEDSIIVPLMSLAFKPQYIEKHVILKRNQNRIDHFSSLEPKELAVLKSKLLYYQKAFFDKKKFSNKEIKYRKTVKKNWVASKDINVGDILSLNNMKMKRINSKNFEPFYFEELKGKICKKKIPRDNLITKNFFNIKVAALVVVRLGSKRLKNKALLKIKKKTCLEILLQRLSYARHIDKIIICTTRNKEDDKIVKIAKKNNIIFFRGSSLNVLSRMLGAVKKNEADLIIRITGDDILIDPEYLDKTIDLSIKRNADYTTNKGIPSGCEVEVFTKKCLLDLKKYSIDPEGTEYLTNYINDHPNEFSVAKLRIPKKIKKNYRLTLDTKNDFIIVKKVVTYFNNLKFSLYDLIKFYERKKNFFSKINKSEKKKYPIKFSTEMNWSR